MAYAVKADVQKRITDAKLVQLTDFAATGAMDDAKITEALAHASGIVDSYTRGRYVLPLVASDQVKDLTVALAVYRLHSMRQLMNDQVAKDYEDAVRLLKDVSAGRAALDQPPTSVQATEMDVKKPDREDDPRTFEDSKMEGF